MGQLDTAHIGPNGETYRRCPKCRYSIYSTETRFTNHVASCNKAPRKPDVQGITTRERQVRTDWILGYYHDIRAERPHRCAQCRRTITEDDTMRPVFKSQPMESTAFPVGEDGWVHVACARAYQQDVQRKLEDSYIDDPFERYEDFGDDSRWSPSVEEDE